MQSKRDGIGDRITPKKEVGLAAASTAAAALVVATVAVGAWWPSGYGSCLRFRRSRDRSPSAFPAQT